MKKQKLGIMMGIAANRHISLNKGQYQRVDTINIKENGTEVYLKEVGDVKVFKKQIRNDMVRFYAVILPEDLDVLSVDRDYFLELHNCHWGIECYHRALKQLCGIGKFLVRNSQAILNHFCQCVTPRFNIFDISVFILSCNF